MYKFQAGRTPLHIAASTGNTDVIEELVRKCPLKELKEFLNDHMVRICVYLYLTYMCVNITYE